MAQYFSLYSRLFWPTVQRRPGPPIPLASAGTYLDSILAGVAATSDSAIGHAEDGGEGGSHEFQSVDVAFHGFLQNLKQGGRRLWVEAVMSETMAGFE